MIKKRILVDTGEIQVFHGRPPEEEEIAGITAISNASPVNYAAVILLPPKELKELSDALLDIINSYQKEN